MTRAGIEVDIHAFTDGRDTPPQSGAADLEQLQAALPDGARIATVCGRYYAMDRDNRWDRVEKAYLAVAEGTRRMAAADAASVMDRAYGGWRDGRVRDPVDRSRAIAECVTVTGLLSFNFRADRIREILGRADRSGVQWVQPGRASIAFAGVGRIDPL